MTFGNCLMRFSQVPCQILSSIMYHGLDANGSWITSSLLTCNGPRGRLTKWHTLLICEQQQMQMNPGSESSPSPAEMKRMLWWLILNSALASRLIHIDYSRISIQLFELKCETFQFHTYMHPNFIGFQYENKRCFALS